MKFRRDEARRGSAMTLHPDRFLQRVKSGGPTKTQRGRSRRVFLEPLEKLDLTGVIDIVKGCTHNEVKR